MKRFLLTLLDILAFFACLPAPAAPSEISVNMQFCVVDPLDRTRYIPVSDYVIGERVYAIVDIANSCPDKISVGYSNSKDAFFVEVFRVSNHQSLTRISSGPFVQRFVLKSGEGQKLGTYLDDHYDLLSPSRYFAKPVLVHNGVRYEGQPRCFDVVEGIGAGGAMQMFANRKGLQRNFRLVYWSRNHLEHLFLTAVDAGNQTRRWKSRDLGSILRIDMPSVSILPTGEVVVLHRLNQDEFIRTEFWSLPDALEFRSAMTVNDPETAGTTRVRELYKDKGVTPEPKPWWKFW